MEPKLYTTPPYTIPWPYIITNPRRRRWILSYLRKHKKHIGSIIIDSGVEIFRSRNGEYPGGSEKWFGRMLELKKAISSIVDAEIWVVSPDYPSDYPGNPIPNNIERTLRVLRWVEKTHGTEGVIAVVQGKPIWMDQNLETFIWALKQYREAGVLKKYGYVALGTVCTLSSIRLRGIREETAITWIKKSVELLRRETNSKIHVFGLWLRALRTVKNMITSFDSQAWTRPVTRKLKKNWSAKNTREREQYFWAWVERYLGIVRQKQLL